MELRTQKLRLGPHVMAHYLLVLLMNGLVAGNLLNLRQTDNTDKSTVIAPTAPPETSATSVLSSVSGSTIVAESASSPSATSIPERPVLASATTSGTKTASAASTTTSSALNSTGTDNDTLTGFNDPSFCHINFTAGHETNPFCEPIEGSILDVNASYEVTWDATLFANGSNVTISLLDLNATENATTLILDVDSALGHASLNTTSDMLNGSSTATMSLYANSTKDGQPFQYPGPAFELVDKSPPGHNSTTSKSGDSSDSQKKLGEKVGIPIGLIFLLIILAALAFFFLRYRRNSSGYASRKSLVQRTNTGSTRAGGAGGGHRHQESFHDEPTSGGVELQNRNRGLTGEDSWDWGRDSVGSPTSPSSGNQFRDELARQKGIGKR